MAIEDMQKETQKRQRAIMRQIVSRRIKIAALTTEVEQLQNELAEIPTTVAEHWLITTAQQRLELREDVEL